MTRRASLTLVLMGALLVSSACGPGTGLRSTEDDGYAAHVQEETDAVASAVVPAAAEALGATLNAPPSSYEECDVSGWRYVVEGDLLGGATGSEAASSTVASLLDSAGLDVERREDGSVVGRDGDLSVLVGDILGPADNPFRHYTFTHACAGYSATDEERAETFAGTSIG